MLKQYFPQQYLSDKEKIKIITASETGSKPFFPELARNLSFLDIDSIVEIHPDNRESFVFVTYFLAVIDQILHTYFPSYKFCIKGEYEALKIGHFGMGGAAHVDSPRDLLYIFFDDYMFDADKVSDSTLNEYTDFFIEKVFEVFSIVNERNLGTAFFLSFFYDTDLHPRDGKTKGHLIYKRLYAKIYERVIRRNLV